MLVSRSPIHAHRASCCGLLCLLVHLAYPTLCPRQLPPPAAHGRAAAKTHLPTDEAALKQLQHLSPLPGLVIQHRALQVGGMDDRCMVHHRSYM